MQMTDYIKGQWQAAVQSVPTAPPGKIMSMYGSNMQQLCSRSQEHLNHIHISAILYGTAQIFLADKRHHDKNFSVDVYGPSFRAFLSRMLTIMLELLLAATCRATSSILWSFAKLNLNPDELVPGSVDSLAERFVHEMDTASDQAYAHFASACVKLQLDPCKGVTF